MGKRTHPIKDVKTELALYQLLAETDTMLFILIIIIRFTGFRVGDLMTLKKRDILGDYLEIVENKPLYLEEKYSTCQEKLHRKRIKPPRKVLIHPALRKELDEYTKHMKNCQPLFPSKLERNQPMSYSQLNRRLMKAGKFLGIKDFGFHALRKTCFYNFYIENGRNVQKVHHFEGNNLSEITIRHIGLKQAVNDEMVRKMNNPLEKLSE